MEFRDFTTGKDDDGRRLDRVLRIFMNDKSLSEIYKLIRKGLIKVNHKKTKPEAHVNQGDVISIADFLFAQPKSPQTKDKTPVEISSPDSLNIVFENEHLLIIDKPYGRSVHGSKNDETGLDKEVLSYWEAQNSADITAAKSLSFRPGPLHRLDKNTTGLLVFSKSLEGAKWFSESIKNHIVQKKYLGIAEGSLKKAENWEDQLADSEEDENIGVSNFHTVSQNNNGKTAITRATPLAQGSLRGKPITLVEYAIKTGRKHQIRAQSQLHKHPLLGDKAYGGTPQAPRAEAALGSPQAPHDKSTAPHSLHEYYLHAYSLSFPADNPLGLPSEIKTDLPDDFKALLQYCEIENHGL